MGYHAAMDDPTDVRAHLFVSQWQDALWGVTALSIVALTLPCLVLFLSRDNGRMNFGWFFAILLVPILGPTAYLIRRGGRQARETDKA